MEVIFVHWQVTKAVDLGEITRGGSKATPEQQLGVAFLGPYNLGTRHPSIGGYHVLAGRRRRSHIKLVWDLSCPLDGVIVPTSNWCGTSLPCSMHGRAPQTLAWRSLTHWQSPLRSAVQAYVNRNDSNSLSLRRGAHSTVWFVDTALDSELSCSRCSRATHSLESGRYPRTTTPPACDSGPAVQRQRTEETFRHLRQSAHMCGGDGTAAAGPGGCCSIA